MGEGVYNAPEAQVHLCNKFMHDTIWPNLTGGEGSPKLALKLISCLVLLEKVLESDLLSNN